MSIPSNEEFKALVLNFFKKSDLSKNALGRKSINDTRFYFDLIKGRKFGEDIKLRVLNFINNYEKEKSNGTDWQGFEN